MSVGRYAVSTVADHDIGARDLSLRWLSSRSWGGVAVIKLIWPDGVVA